MMPTRPATPPRVAGHPRRHTCHMSLMTAQPTQSLEELQDKLAELVERRRVLIEQAERIIATANREFDREALRLGREINKLQSWEERLPERTHEAPRFNRPRKRAAAKPKPMLNLEGLTPEEVKHFHQLLNKKG